MSRFFEGCAGGASGGTIAGAVVGAGAGLGVAIWTCVAYIQPAFASIEGVSPAAASAITAGIALCGYIEVAAALGGSFGACTFAVIGAALGTCGGGCIDSSREKTTSDLENGNAIPNPNTVAANEDHEEERQSNGLSASA